MVFRPFQRSVWCDMVKKGWCVMGTIFLTLLVIALLSSAGVPSEPLAAFGVVMIISLFLPKSWTNHTSSYSSKRPVVNMTPSQYESYVATAFSQQGYTKVRVIGGTGDFGADVLCEDGDGRKVCIQCKKYAKPVGVAAVQEIIGAKGFYGCQRAMVVTTVGFTPAAHQLAAKNGVELYTLN